MKLVSVVLSMFIVLFTMIFVSCDSDSKTGSPDTSGSCTNCSADTAIGEDVADEQDDNEDSKTPYGTCGDGHCNIVGTLEFEDCNICPEDCGCWNGMVCEDDGKCYDNQALADYYWLEGQWLCKSVDGISCEEYTGIVDVTVEAWDDELGAEVHGFEPILTSYIKKNAETNEFVLFVEYDNGAYAEGFANKDSLTLEFDFHLENDGGIKKNIYVKL